MPYTNVPVPSCNKETWGIVIASFCVKPSIVIWTNNPGIKILSLFSKVALALTVDVVESTIVSRKSNLPFCPYSLPSLVLIETGKFAFAIFFQLLSLTIYLF